MDNDLKNSHLAEVDVEIPLHTSSPKLKPRKMQPNKLHPEERDFRENSQEIHIQIEANIDENKLNSSPNHLWQSKKLEEEVQGESKYLRIKVTIALTFIYCNMKHDLHEVEVLDFLQNECKACATMYNLHLL